MSAVCVHRYTEPSAVWDPLFISTIGVDFKVRTCQRCDKVSPPN